MKLSEMLYLVPKVVFPLRTFVKWMQLFAIQKSKNVADSSLSSGWLKKPSASIYSKFWFVSKSHQQDKGALFREKVRHRKI